LPVAQKTIIVKNMPIALLPFRILWVIGRLIDLFVEHKTGNPLFRTSTQQGGHPGPKVPDASVLMRQPAADPAKALVLSQALDFAAVQIELLDGRRTLPSEPAHRIPPMPEL
jgi:hypothetical protein